jgi:hypothetical protein
MLLFHLEKLDTTKSIRRRSLCVRHHKLAEILFVLFIIYMWGYSKKDNILDTHHNLSTAKIIVTLLRDVGISGF